MLWYDNTWSKSYNMEATYMWWHYYTVHSGGNLDVMALLHCTYHTWLHKTYYRYRSPLQTFNLVLNQQYARILAWLLFFFSIKMIKTYFRPIEYICYIKQLWFKYYYIPMQPFSFRETFQFQGILHQDCNLNCTHSLWQYINELIVYYIRLNQ